MDILSKLPFLSKDETREIIESEEDLKAARIEFHRSRVHNGPVNYKEPTSGQIRRAKERALRRQTLKARRAQIRGFFATQQEIAILRGNLQAAGVLSYADDTRIATAKQAWASVIWLTERFADDSIANEHGEVVVTREVVINALTSGFNRYQSLHGLPVTSLSPAYRLPVQVAA